MRKILFAAIALLIIVGIAFKGDKEYAPTRYFGPAGEDMAPSGRKVWRAEVTPTAATYAIPITTAAFSTIQGVYITPKKNTNAANAPMVTIKSMTNDTLTVNLQQANSSLVSVLGFNVLSGPALLMPTDLTGVTLLVTVTGK